MEKNWDIVEVLRHSRHDWLNRLQLIKGNLDLDRVDRAKAVIDEIIIETQQEAKLSSLKMPLFTALLLKANWEERHFKLEYDVLMDAEVHLVDDCAITEWTASFFSVLDEAVEPYQDNSLCVCIEQSDGGVRFIFEFSGIIKEECLIKEFLEKQDGLNASSWNSSDRELTTEVLMPFL